MSSLENILIKYSNTLAGSTVDLLVPFVLYAVFSFKMYVFILEVSSKFSYN